MDNLIGYTDIIRILGIINGVNLKAFFSSLASRFKHGQLNCAVPGKNRCFT